MRKLFGTDGVRGVANIHPMTAEIAMQLGRAIAYLFKKEPRRHKIVIGKDTRLSGYMLETAMASGICSMGVDVMLVGPLPTPGIAFITSSMRADAGVVISASHNPYQDNGIKFFSRDGFKLPDKLEAEIENFIFDKNEPSHRPTAGDIGKAHRIDDAIGRYVVFAKNTFPKELTLDGLKIAVDCANGAAYKVAPEVFYELGAEVFPIGVQPDGGNINDKCGSLYPEVVAKLVKEKKADIGIALDGDGDRMILHGYNVGGEQSGHLIFMDHTTTGDGIISALQVLAIMVKEGKKLSELSGIMRTFPQILVNVKVKEKKDLLTIPHIAKRIKEVESKLNGHGRLSVRYSGTELLARVMLEGKDEKEIKKMARYIADAIEAELGIRK
ncbi:MAG: phosphoglucosamine mutase [Deltaproteobacteria bacterium]|nr:phosphoglucosamine mutase [Deltaproteobacteria bacterium]